MTTSAVLVTLLCVGLVLRHVAVSRGDSSSPAHIESPQPVGAPLLTPAAAARLDRIERVIDAFGITPPERFALVRDLYEDGEITAREALALLGDE